MIGGCDGPTRTAISAYGAKLGLLFQITDDVLMLSRRTESLGKTAGKDEASAKATYPSIYGIEGAKEAALRAHAECIDALHSLGKSAERLRSIADLILNRQS